MDVAPMWCYKWVGGWMDHWAGVGNDWCCLVHHYDQGPWRGCS